MASQNPPPWRNERSNLPQRHAPARTVPAKRSANERTHDSRGAKRPNTTNAAEEEWVAGENRFVLAQSKKKAALRVKGGRAKPIDWLAVTLRFVDPTKEPGDDEVDDEDLEVVDPEGVLEGLDAAELSALEKEIEHFLTLETNRSNCDYWTSLKAICKDLRRKAKKTADARGTSSVAADIDQLLAPKTFEQLEALEAQVERKLDSDEPIDFDYWEQLLRSLRVWKAKAKLRRVSQEIVRERLEALRREQAEAAAKVQERIWEMLRAADASRDAGPTTVAYDAALDPEPLLKLRAEDKALAQVEATQLLDDVANERRKIQKLGYVPMQASSHDRSTGDSSKPTTSQAVTTSASRFAPAEREDYSQATMALFEREVARGVEEGEEIFTAEEEVATARPQWAGSYKPRKPRYFNRVQMGYEWNKYNQTHYDHDNPPPKVVQGYKFNIFYPDLVDKTKAPTYKIERENGRKRGQSFAPAGEDDTCLIRFVSGPPYEDIAFRIIDKEWDYSARRERGFKSSFDKGILQLHFQFKKIYYRK